MDGLGAQARQAPRAEPPAARRRTDTSFIPENGRAARVPPDVRYVVTLDADTRLPIGAVSVSSARWRTRSTGRASIQPTQRVVEGYAVLQPRVTRAAARDARARCSSGCRPASRASIPYAAAVSDVYQDLFGEGSYTGKGIYDVDAFEAALAGRVPENTLLSHDLFEGHLRARRTRDRRRAVRERARALSRRRQRASIAGRAATGSCCRGFSRERLRAASARWKMVDNLRRTLSAPAAFLTLLLGWTLDGSQPLLWSAFVLAVIVRPADASPPIVGMWPRAPRHFASAATAARSRAISGGAARRSRS